MHISSTTARKIKNLSNQQYYHSYHLSLVIIPLRITTLLLSYFLVSGLIHSDIMVFWFFPVASTTWLECIATTFIWIVYLLEVAMSFCSEVLISIKSTRIIVGGYHGIRLYEREMQPHGVCRHWHCQTQTLHYRHIFW